jgi:hypothetical protein
LAIWFSFGGWRRRERKGGAREQVLVQVLMIFETLANQEADAERGRDHQAMPRNGITTTDTSVVRAIVSA